MTTFSLGISQGEMDLLMEASILNEEIKVPVRLLGPFEVFKQEIHEKGLKYAKRGEYEGEFSYCGYLFTPLVLKGVLRSGERATECLIILLGNNENFDGANEGVVVLDEDIF